MPPSRERTILHVDMDAFFASVEQRDDPSLRGKPVIVGGPSRRGVVCAASYEARPFGVRSAMPVGEALRRCPQALVVPPRREAYSEASGHVFSIFRRYTPLVQGLSLDEAFLDVSGCEGLFGDGITIARAIKAAIFEETRLRASAGVGPTKFTAKIASDLRKPDGLVEVPDDVPAFLAPMAIERIWGVGPKTAEVLRGVGLTTIGHVARLDLASLERLVGPALSAHLHELARGHDPRVVEPDAAPKSIGAEETYEHDITSLEVLERHLLSQSERVCRRALREGWEGRVVILKIKMADFSLKTRRTTLESPVRDTRTLYQTIRDLLRVLDPLAHGGRVRLSGVALQGLSPSGTGQRTLFPDQQRVKREALEETMLRLTDRFGGKAITRADTLLADEGMGGNDPRRRSLGADRRRYFLAHLARQARRTSLQASLHLMRGKGLSALFASHKSRHLPAVASQASSQVDGFLSLSPSPLPDPPLDEPPLLLPPLPDPALPALPPLPSPRASKARPSTNEPATNVTRERSGRRNEETIGDAPAYRESGSILPSFARPWHE